MLLLFSSVPFLLETISGMDSFPYYWDFALPLLGFSSFFPQKVRKVRIHLFQLLHMNNFHNSSFLGSELVRIRSFLGVKFVLFSGPVMEQYQALVMESLCDHSRKVYTTRLTTTTCLSLYISVSYLFLRSLSPSSRLFFKQRK